MINSREKNVSQLLSLTVGQFLKILYQNAIQGCDLQLFML